MPTPKNHPTQKNTTIQPLSINSLLKFARARQCTHQRSSDFWSYHAAYIYSRVRCVCISSINLYIGIHWSRWAWSAYFLFLRAHRATNLSALETNNYRPPRAPTIYGKPPHIDRPVDNEAKWQQGGHRVAGFNEKWGSLYFVPIVRRNQKRNRSIAHLAMNTTQIYT